MGNKPPFVEYVAQSVKSHGSELLTQMKGGVAHYEELFWDVHLESVAL